MNRPPNPRLQRTRLRAVGATARPLSRKPLDAHGKAKRRKHSWVGVVGLLAVNALAGADVITQQEPLLSTPAGWEFKDIGHIHYWSGEYTDSLSGAVVEFHISSPSYFGSICQSDPDAESVMAEIAGVPVCEQEFQDARSWGLARLKESLPQFPVGSPGYMDLVSQLPPEGSSMLWITFLPPGAVWQFDATFCTLYQRSRILELLVERVHLNLHHLPTTRKLASAGASNTGVQQISLRSTADAESLDAQGP
jgi:hypothetical protein